MSKISGTSFIENTTDFRIFDKKVAEVFSMTTERQRLFRGIIDWIGFKRDFLEFTANDRINGKQRYSYKSKK